MRAAQCTVASSASGQQRGGVPAPQGGRGGAVTRVAAPQAGSAAGMAAPHSAEAFVRPHLLKLKAYTPIEPFEILAQRLGRDAADIVKLDANENPYGPPPEVAAALAAMPFPHIYPDPESRRLREALAKWHGVPAEHLLVRAGRAAQLAVGSGGVQACMHVAAAAACTVGRRHQMLVTPALHPTCPAAPRWAAARTS